MNKASPHCKFCAQDKRVVDADFMCAQSTDQGKTITWVFTCRDHKAGWNEDGDWQAPIYKICVVH